MIVIIGPSGSGKTTIANMLQKRGYKLSISYTTRKPRKGEVNGVHYRFITKDEFRKKIMQDFFVEWAPVGDELYGTSKEDLIDDIIKIVEPNGLRQLMSKGDILVTYISAPDSLRMERMKKRGQDEDEICSRDIIDKTVFTPDVEELACIVFDNSGPITEEKIDKLHEAIQVCQMLAKPMSKHKNIPKIYI
jgi:guanylate kinase